MRIVYKNIHKFTQNQLRDLFLSVEWSSGQYPEKLVKAMERYETVYSAWDGEKLVGLVAAMDDGIMTSYVHYVLVNPDYQHNGIGKTLINMIKDTYKDYLRIVLVSYDSGIEFYHSCGFKESDHAVPMYITSLWT